MRTRDLCNVGLDLAVAMCQGLEEDKHIDFLKSWIIHGNRWSTDWAQGGPIIEREGIALYLYEDTKWSAYCGEKEYAGPTPLIAAMRCYVAIKLGDEVELPWENSLAK